MNVFKIAMRMVKFYQDIIGGQSIKNDGVLYSYWQSMMDDEDKKIALLTKKWGPKWGMS